jgi:hypothetical protein
MITRHHPIDLLGTQPSWLRLLSTLALVAYLGCGEGPDGTQEPPVVQIDGGTASTDTDAGSDTLFPNDELQPLTDPAGAGIEPLPASSLLYADADGNFFVYDVKSMDTRKIDAMKTVLLGPEPLFSLSPNRKWIVFPGAPDAADVEWNNASAPGIYVMSVDGAIVKKAIPTIPAPGLTTCDADFECGNGTCNESTGLCSGVGISSITPTQLRWSNDGETIWFKLSFSDANLSGGNALVGANLRSGEITELASQLPCIFFHDPAPHPRDNTLLIPFYGTNGDAGCMIDSGLYLYPYGGGDLQPLPMSSAGWLDSLESKNFQWADDGSGIFFVQPSNGSYCLFAYDIQSQSREVLYGNELQDVVHFVSSPASEQKAILCTKNKETREYTAILLDINDANNTSTISIPHACQIDW